MSRRAYANDHSRRRDTAESDHDPLAAMTPTAATAENAPTPLPAVAESPQLGHNFGQIVVQPAPTVPQMALRVSDPGDTHEREARDVAEQVMRMPEPAASAATETTAHSAASVPAEAAQAIPGDGQPLDTATRASMEPRFGHDFAKVRVHTDARAAEAAASYSARAYTLGSDIVFGAGEYAPATAAGQHLLAHELTHVVQHDASAAEPTTIHREPANAPEAVPEPVPEPASAHAESPAEKTDEELARNIMDKQLAILAGWQGALGRFDKVLSSASDKEAKPQFAKVVKDFFGEKVMGELLKHSLPPTSEAFALLGKLDAEVKRAKAADESAAIRDFFVEHIDAITTLVQSTLSTKEDFVTKVRKTREAMELAENIAAPSVKGRKGKPSVTIAATKEADEYGILRMNLVDTVAEMDARVKVSTPQILFLRLSEEWMRYATVTGPWGRKYQAVVVIRLNPDYSIKDAHIQGAGGQKIAEQLLKDNPNGVNVFNLEAPRRVLHLAENGWPSAILSLDENDRDTSTGSIAEGHTDALYRKLMTEGLPPTKKLDGD